jgi:hypothetical protein
MKLIYGILGLAIIAIIGVILYNIYGFRASGQITSLKPASASNASPINSFPLQLNGFNKTAAESVPNTGLGNVSLQIYKNLTTNSTIKIKQYINQNAATANNIYAKLSSNISAIFSANNIEFKRIPNLPPNFNGAFEIYNSHYVYYLVAFNNATACTLNYTSTKNISIAFLESLTAVCLYLK